MRTKLVLFGLLLIGTSLLASCNSSGNSTTIVNQGLDCGLIFLYNFPTSPKGNLGSKSG